ncbi:MAG: phosphoglycerate mutase [Myxococcota bacterium]|nr:phosphoglycerate mutase [Myxococcota bacterium]
MLEQQLLSQYRKQSDNRILLIIVDGLGGLGHPNFDNKSELEYAALPHLDAFVQRKETVLGNQYPVARGIIPGSAAGHFALFGYDPLDEQNHIGRGILEAIDLDIPIEKGDIVARLNVASVKDGIVTDRRAGRIDAGPLVDCLNREVTVDGIRVKFVSTREHRGVLFLKKPSKQLSPDITDTDPGEEGKPILTSTATVSDSSAAERTAAIINQITAQASQVLDKTFPGHGILLRGFSSRPDLPTLSELHGMDCVAIADYPLYRGIAKLLGMTACDPLSNLRDKVSQLRQAYDTGTFFFMHYKTPDSKGEDKDFLGKVQSLEAFDQVFPDILDVMDLSRDVIVVTGDHSTPALLGKHSHHSVPVAIFSSVNRGYDRSEKFTEQECLNGSLGRIMGKELMGCMLARAGKLKKFDL